MTRTILIFCVLFCASAMNLVIPTDRMLQVSPQEQFTGRRLNMATDLRFGFGDYVQATVANTDNTMKTRTEGCIALLSTGSSSGSVRMLHLATDRVVTRVYSYCPSFCTSIPPRLRSRCTGPRLRSYQPHYSSRSTYQYDGCTTRGYPSCFYASSSGIFRR